ncbi:cell division protein FtsK, partial [Streptomyces heilongjiangensis]
MTETTAFPPPEDPEGTEQPTADIVPFPLKKKTDPADPATPAGVVKPGEWEAELPDTDDPEADGLTDGAPVDPPREVYPPSVAEWMEAKDKARMPVLPDWVKLPDQRTAVRKWAIRHYSAVAGYHAVRLPLVYTPKICMYSPRGAWRWSTAIGRWLFDAEGKTLRLASVANEDAAEYLKLSRQRNDRVRLRGIVATIAGFVGLAAALT